MAVYPNGRYALRNPGRYFGAAPGLDLYARVRGDRLNVYTAPTWDEIIGGSPTGYGLTGVVPPIRSGAMSARVETHISVTATGAMVKGLPASGTAEISITVADATGELIVSGSGSASIQITTSSPLLTAAASMAGAASVSIDVNTPTLGAMADLIGTTEFSVSAGGTLSAIGIMSGTTEDATGMTPAGVAQAVWAAVASEFDAAGTMGQKVNAAGTAGDPWTADLSGYADGAAGYSLAIVDKLLRNKQITDPVTGKMFVYDGAGETAILMADLFQDADGTVPYRGKGAERREGFRACS